MDEALKKLLAEMASSVKALNETITSKFSSAAPDAAAAEKQKMSEKITDLQKQIDEIHKVKAVQKMVWSLAGKEIGEGVEAKEFKHFLKAVVHKDSGFLDQMGVKAANGQSEATNADGGFTVPTEYANEIIKLERIFGVARRICRIFPMGSLTRKIPRQLTNPTMTWTSEAVNHTKTKITVEQVTQTAKKLSALVPLTEELLNDNNVNLDAFIFQIVAEAFGREEDRVVFAGKTANSDAFNGILGATNVNAVSMAGATLDWKDIVSLIMTLKTPYRRAGRARFVLSTAALQKVMQLRDDQNRPIWIAPQTVGTIEGPVPGTIFGYPYEETDQIPTNLGSGAQSAIEFGPFGDHLWLSDRGTYEVKASDSASDANGGAGSAFLQDEIWYKFRRRQDITVAQPEAFAYMLV